MVVAGGDGLLPLGPLAAAVANLLPIGGMAFRNEMPAAGKATTVWPASCAAGTWGQDLEVRASWFMTTVIGPSTVCNRAQRTSA